MFPTQQMLPMQQLMGLQRRVERLEEAQALSLELMYTVLDRLESKLGPGFVADKLTQWTAAEMPDQGEMAAQLNELVRKGERPKVTRLFRELTGLTGLTWDEAHAIVGCWTNKSYEQNFRWIQLAKWIRAFDCPGDAVESATQVNHNS